MNVDHVLLTRYNLPSRGAESLIRARQHWLQQRTELFERYCLPSVLAQTAPVRWIIYLDPESPGWLKERMAAHASAGTFTPVYREEVPREDLLSDLRSVVPEPAEVLVTTNLDNDDGLSRDFAARVQAATSGGLPHAVYVDHGLVLGGGHAYLRRDPRNAFCSVAESWEAPVSCWSAWHNELEQAMPGVHVAGGPGWLQVIHGDNVSNRVRGRVVSPETYRRDFPGLLDVPVPGRRELALERLAWGPGRSVREAGRAGAKKLVLLAGGRRALESAHARVNAWSSRAT